MKKADNFKIASLLQRSLKSVSIRTPRVRGDDRRLT